MRFALLGDIHAYQLLVKPWQLLNRRVIGQMNLWLNRRHHFDMSLLPHVVDRIGRIEPDWLLMSGDLTTTSLKREFELVAKALGTLPPQIKLCMVPGNHDRYTFASHRLKVMEDHFREVIDEAFPRLEYLTESWQMLALDTAVPRIKSSRGRLGRQQFASAQAHLQNVPDDSGLIVVSHYPFTLPPDVHQSRNHGLEDARRMEALLEKRNSPIIYIHGHIHQPWVHRPNDDRLHHVVNINAGSPTMTSDRFPHGQGFWELEIPEDSRDTAILTHHVPTGRRDDDWTSQSVAMPEIKPGFLDDVKPRSSD